MTLAFLAIFMSIIIGAALFIGLLERSEGGSATDKWREIAKLFWDGPRQVILPYQCERIDLWTGESRTTGLTLNRDGLWVAKLLIVGSWYLLGVIIVIAMIASLIVTATIQPGFWTQADSVIATGLAIWFISAYFVSMAALVLSQNQFYQCLNSRSS